MEDNRGREEKLKEGKSERETNLVTLDSGNQIDGYRREGVGVWGSLVVGIEEGTCCDNHWVLYTNNESWNTTSKTKDVLYGDSHNIIKF